MSYGSAGNIDLKTVEGFGEEWHAYSQEPIDSAEHQRLFERYFSIFPFESLPPDAEGFDLGCGSGRWAVLVARRVGTLHCVDPSHKALEVCRRRLSGLPNARFHLAGADEMPLAEESQDFGYSLGVLHHIPDTASAMRDAVRKLKPGAPFLVYLYYDFENRPGWFKALWRASDLSRRAVSRMPFGLKKTVSSGIALLVYWPLSRAAKLLERTGANVRNMPLSGYRNDSVYTLRTDALDRFGTRLEQRFSRVDIEQMMRQTGLTDVRFREEEPYWVACGRKAL